MSKLLPYLRGCFAQIMQPGQQHVSPTGYHEPQDPDGAQASGPDLRSLCLVAPALQEAQQLFQRLGVMWERASARSSFPGQGWGIHGTENSHLPSTESDLPVFPGLPSGCKSMFWTYPK